MSRKLAHIEKIEWIQPIEGKDRIVLAGVLGWTVIIKKDEFAVGDKVIFCEIDSVFPEKPEYEFLRKNKFRIKTMKMSGVLSQGICFPLSMIPDKDYEIGEDVTELMGITQYQATMDDEPVVKETAPAKHYPEFLMRWKWFRKLVLPKKEYKGFPTFVSKTDEVRCLGANVKIETDKGLIRIADIVNKQLNVNVKSYNESTGNIEWNKINSYQKYNTPEKWLEIIYPITPYCNRRTRIKCTADHMFYTDKGYVKAESLAPNNYIYQSVDSWDKNDIYNIFGMIIGDACVCRDSRPSKNGYISKKVRISFTQGEKQLEYLKEKIRIIDGNIQNIHRNKSGYCGNNVYAYTSNIDEALTDELYSLGCMETGKFRITKEFCNLMTEQALAFWYMDDGTLRHRDGADGSPSIQISTNSESKEETCLLIEMLKNRFGVECNYRQDKDRFSSIYITVNGTKTFLKMITKYMPNCMRYKTTPDLVKEPYVLMNTVYKKNERLTKCKIESVKVLPKSKFAHGDYSYDIEVNNNHNFFANRVLTHNCQNAPHFLNMECKWVATEKVDGQSGTFALQRIKGKHFWNKDKYDFAVCSRNLRLYTPDKSSYWINAKKYDIEQVLHKLIGNNEWVCIQGECVAPNVQGNKYRVHEPDLYVFNVIYPTGRMNSIDAKQLMEKHGLKFVPIINECISLKGMNVADVLDYATGQSALYNTLREGIVFRTLDGKQSFKAVSPEFLIKNNE